VKRLYDVAGMHSLNPDALSNVYYYENIEGGHGGAADNKQTAFMNVLYIDFLWSTIGK
jgi:prolyl oligopeptidase